MKSLLCPVSPARINRNATRVTALLMAALMAIYIGSGGAAVIVVLLAGTDYFVRGFTPAASPFGKLAASLSSLAGFAWRPTDKAPKIFAARVGFLVAGVAAALHWLAPDASVAMAAALLGFAMLESVLDVCVGCLVYTYVVLPATGGPTGK